MKFTLPATLLFSALATLQAADTGPHILVLFADDLGYADLGCQGSAEPNPEVAFCRRGCRNAT